MEERIIDDEYGRGIRLKKTKDGYVDATDELSERDKEKNKAENEEKETTAKLDGELEDEIESEIENEIDGEEMQSEAADEVIFEFPEEDDEELAALSAEDAAALIRKREEERKKREEKAETLCAEGETLLEKAKGESGEEAETSYSAAAEKFDAALVEIPCYKRAALGFWRAKTHYGETLQPLYNEWASYGYEEFAATFGEEAVKELRTEWGEKAEAEKTRLAQEIAPLKKDYEEKTEKRRVVLKERVYNTRKKFVPALSVEIALLVFAVIFAANIFSREDALFVWLTIAGGAMFVIALPFFCIAASRFAHAVSLSRANEMKSSTEEGRRLVALEDSLEFLTDMTSAERKSPEEE